MRRVEFWFSVICLAFFVVGGAQADDDPKEKKFTNEQVMKKAFGGKKPLMAKLASRKASKAEIDRALVYLKALAKNKPTNGPKESWKKKTEELVKATEGIKKGGDKAYARFAKAINCKACHDLHQ